MISQTWVDNLHHISFYSFLNRSLIFSDHLKDPLSDYVSNLPKVKLLRAHKREGLIRARMRGANFARAPTLTFLDAHIECTEGWLEPLLERIALNQTTVVCPVIDVIDDRSFEFRAMKTQSPSSVGGFTWKLRFVWYNTPQRELKRREHPADPLHSPVMAGGLFTIDKAYFELLGMYDPGKTSFNRLQIH